MAVTLFLVAPIFFMVIFLSTTIYYRSKVRILQKRLEKMSVAKRLSERLAAQTKDSIELLFDGKDNQFKLLRTAEEDTKTVKSP